MRSGISRYTFSVAALAAVLASGVVAAHGGSGPMGSGMDGGGEGMHGHGAMHGGGKGAGPVHGRGMVRGPGMMMGHGAMMRGMGPYMSGVLGLSEEQEAQIEEIQEGSARAHWDLMQQMHERHRALMQVRAEPNPAPEAVGEAYAGVAEIKRQMIELRVRTRRDIRGVLDSEQQDRFDRMRRHHGSRH